VIGLLRISRTEEEEEGGKKGVGKEEFVDLSTPQ